MGGEVRPYLEKTCKGTRRVWIKILRINRSLLNSILHHFYIFKLAFSQSFALDSGTFIALLDQIDGMSNDFNMNTACSPALKYILDSSTFWLGAFRSMPRNLFARAHINVSSAISFVSFLIIKDIQASEEQFSALEPANYFHGILSFHGLFPCFWKSINLLKHHV